MHVSLIPQYHRIHCLVLKWRVWLPLYVRRINSNIDSIKQSYIYLNLKMRNQSVNCSVRFFCFLCLSAYNYSLLTAWNSDCRAKLSCMNLFESKLLRPNFLNKINGQPNLFCSHVPVVKETRILIWLTIIMIIISTY